MTGYSSDKTIRVCKAGNLPYGEALSLQERLVCARIEGRCEDTLLILEHPPVITKGTRTDERNIYLPEEEIKKRGVEIFGINRGGDVTFHGPGQIVGYPIVQLKEFENGIRWFIQSLEKAIMDVLKTYGIESYTKTGKYTGVWTGEKKIAAFGLAVKHGVTMHGFAFNVNTDLSYFDFINPCGLSMGVTSIEKEMGESTDIRECEEKLISAIGNNLGVKLSEVTLEEIEEI